MCVAMVEGKGAPVRGGPHLLYNHLRFDSRELTKIPLLSNADIEIFCFVVLQCSYGEM